MVNPTDENTQADSTGSVSQEDLADELHRLGQNLKEALHTIWDSQERKKLQTELEAGLKNVGEALNEVASELSQSEMAQHLKEDVEDLEERIREGQLDVKVRNDLVSILRTVNTELKNLAARKKTDQ
jgi:hypothetical protein